MNYNIKCNTNLLQKHIPYRNVHVKVILISNCSYYLIFFKINNYKTDISLENTVKSLNLNKYTSSNRYENKEYNITFDELMILDQNNIIDKIYGRFDKVQVTINGTKLSSNINDLDSVLDTSYIKSSYDNEQCTYQRIYIDKENKIFSSIHRYIHLLQTLSL